MLSYIKNSIQLIFSWNVCKIFTSFSLLLLIQSGCNPESVELKKYFRIGSGETQGVYYLAAQAIAQLVEKTSKDRAQVDIKASTGSVENINGLSKRRVQFAFAQSDRVYQAYHGEGYWRHRPQNKLRFVCSFHNEALTLIARDDSRIDSLGDLINKKVSLGDKNSSTQVNAVEVLEAVNLQADVDFDRVYFSSNDLFKELQNGNVDALFYMAGHPNELCAEISKLPQGVHMVPISGINELIEEKPYYFPVEISASYYPRMKGPKKIPSVGVRCVLLSSTEVEDELVYELLETLFKNIPGLQRKHPAFQNLEPENMVKGAVIPVHPGAEQYYKNQGYL